MQVIAYWILALAAIFGAAGIAGNRQTQPVGLHQVHQADDGGPHGCGTSTCRQ